MSDLALKLIHENKVSSNTRLELSRCGLTELPKQLFECIWLKELVLSNQWWDKQKSSWVTSNNIGFKNLLSRLPFEITALQSLKKLTAGGDYARKWEFSDIRPLSKITNLQSINLSYNQISDIDCLENLPNLKSLDVSHNQISSISFQKNLVSLEILDLSNNKLIDFSFLVNLKAIKALYIGNNQINGVNWPQKLIKLQTLDISNNSLLDISFLKNATILQALDLSHNQITGSSFPKNLTDIQNLNLSNNQINDISFLGKLTSLKTLDLSHNNISDVSFLKNLVELKTLNLSGNQINNISFLEDLTNIQELYLNSNQIIEINSLKNLTNLRILNLGFNQIIDVSALKNLLDIQYLDLYQNKIKSILPLETLINLRALNLSNNRLTDIPFFVFQLGLEMKMDGSEYEGLKLSGNFINSPPTEILKQGQESVLDWFGANKKKLNEIKIILIGDPKAGKTSLLRRLKDDSFDEDEPQTDGINIESLEFKKCKTFVKQPSLHKITAHFWDFGGQEIMNSTHQFFLTSRSVYMLVLDARRDNDITGQVRGWLKRIKSTGGSSSIIVIANQIDINSAFGFSNESELKIEFPEIKFFIKASCKTEAGMDEIKEKLAELIPKAEMFNTEIDERWIGVKDLLQKETGLKNFLSETRFKEICRKNSLTEKHQRQNAINFLHDLGLILHFDEVNLTEYYVLNPYWITYGIYQIVTSQRAAMLKGVVPMSELEYIVNDEEDKRSAYQPPEYKKIIYDSHEQRRFLVEILNQFKLCFYLNSHNYFIIPDLLDTIEPTAITTQIRQTKDNISFAYSYGYLPKSVMPYVMVETHNVIKQMWRTGCVLEGDRCTALISSYQNIITLTVTGEYKKKREFMAIIRNYIDAINSKLNDRPIMMVPLPGTNKQAYADYEVLLVKESKGRKYYVFDEDKSTEQLFEISQLLDGIATPDEMQAISDTLKRIENNQRQIISFIDNHYQYLVQKIGDSQLNERVIEALNQLNHKQTLEITNEILKQIAVAFELFNGDIDEKLQKIYEDLKKTDDFEMRLKLSVPLIKLLGIDLETSFDVKRWANEMHEKYKLKLFQLMY